ncbi:hypothetical protein [Pseudomonas proteolytica]|uniref:hypothetical protein n=1 Tax=Pseudomonas proteolytica TaxID=219574 RepID=UPI001472AADB|nr:hypothetical protein [Pseudomonas proteolytica]NMY97711.1 hypothetical protein [Pseudomonas proteolytica]
MLDKGCQGDAATGLQRMGRLGVDAHRRTLQRRQHCLRRSVYAQSGRDLVELARQELEVCLVCQRGPQTRRLLGSGRDDLGACINSDRIRLRLQRAGSVNGAISRRHEKRG